MVHPRFRDEDTSGVIGPLEQKVITLATLLITLHKTTYEPPRWAEAFRHCVLGVHVPRLFYGTGSVCHLLPKGVGSRDKSFQYGYET